MALSGVVKGARHIAQQITWNERDQYNVLSPVDLSGSTITAKKRDSEGTITNVDGSLNFESGGSDGIFNWTYGSNDVAVPGVYEIQFIATYGDTTKDKTLILEWIVYEALD